MKLCTHMHRGLVHILTWWFLKILIFQFLVNFFRKIFKTVSTPTVSLQSFWNFVQTSTGCCLKTLHEDFWKFWILNFWRIFFSKNHEPVFQIVSSPTVFLQSIWNFAYIFMRCCPTPLHGDFWKFWFLPLLSAPPPPNDFFATLHCLSQTPVVTLFTDREDYAIAYVSGSHSAPLVQGYFSPSPAPPPQPNMAKL